jgi:hypothetical protein
MEGFEMSDTPRTDEQINGKPCTRFAILAGDSLRDALVPSEFCRQLERELNAAKDRIKRLEEWKDSAMAVEREWDANAISTMLGGQLGESQRVVIMREVPRILERIKRLEEVGDKLYSAIYCGCLMDGPCKTCSDAADLWDEIKEAKP